MSESDDVEVLTLDDKIKMLRDAGFDLAYACPSTIWPQGEDRGHIRSTDVVWESGPMRYWRGDVTSHPDMSRIAYVSFGNVAAGEDRYNQTSTVNRSNYRSIKRDFPQFPWVDVSYMNRVDLGAFVDTLDQDMIDLLCGLATEYPVYDEGDMSALESDEIDESWDQWLRREIRDHLTEREQDVYDYVWTYGASGDLDDVWWDMVRDDGLGSYPEHNGIEVCWGDLDRAGAVFGRALINFGATWHHAPNPNQLTIMEG